MDLLPRLTSRTGTAYTKSAAGVAFTSAPRNGFAESTNWGAARPSNSGPEKINNFGIDERAVLTPRCD